MTMITMEVEMEVVATGVMVTVEITTKSDHPASPY